MEKQPGCGYDDLLQMLAGEQDDQLISEIAKNPSLVHSASTETGETILHEAAYIGRLGIVKQLLDAGATVDHVGKIGRTPLHYAAIGGHLDVVGELVSRGANTDIKDSEGATPLMFASISGSDKEMMVNLLLSHGATLALNTAIRMGRNDDVRSIIQADADWLQHIRSPGDALATATATRNLQLLKLLLDQGLPVDSKDEAGTTALLRACSDGSTPLAIVSLLLDHGADPNRRENRHSPLERARKVDREDVIDLLRKHGATD